VKARLPYAASGLGVARAALQLAIDYSKERHVFGTALSDKQAIQWMLADSEIEIRAARLMLYQAAWRADLGQDYKVDASAAKVFATEVAGRVVDRCIQIFGGLGVSRELPFERWYRELRVKRIGEGPSEVHRLVVARSLLGTR
jgi:acyl-CoA dehydrogenase